MECLRQQEASIIVREFMTADTAFFKRLSVLFFIELARGRVRQGGVTTNRDAPGGDPTIRNLLMDLEDEDAHRPAWGGDGRRPPVKT